MALPLAFGARIHDWMRDGQPAGPAPAGGEATLDAGHKRAKPPATAAPHAAPWYATLWLTGVDYFSSLGYAPGLAVMAAGSVAPIATLILVAVTFFAAVPVYAMVAKHVPHGEGSLKMTERLTTGWGRLGWLGKTLVLVLLGFAMTDFVITITLSSADATHHVLANPIFAGHLPFGPVTLTAVLILALGAVFLKGFKEAIGIAIAIAVPYMALNAVIIGTGLRELQAHPELVAAWWAKIQAFDTAHLLSELHQIEPGGQHGPLGGLGGGGPWMLAAVSLLVFPKLALGLSGFETGVSVMMHVKAANDAERVSNTRKMLVAAAIIMSLGLVGSSIVTATLVPLKEFAPGGLAAGRALSYLAHTLLGPVFGTVYDINTLLILWFAGASAMAGLLNILPRYLPRFGMSPRWIEYRRPLVLVLTGICLLVNWRFEADVEAQGGAYATGVLVLMTMDTFAVLLAEKASALLTWAFRIILVVFVYVLVVNSAERPDGFKIAALFILTVVVASVWSRWRRASELRVAGIEFDSRGSERSWNELKKADYVVLIPLRSPTPEARRKCEARRIHHHTGKNVKFVFLHVNLTHDPSHFSSPVEVKVVDDGQDSIVEISNAVAVANAIAYVALELAVDEVVIGLLDSGTPVVNAFMYILFGTGEVGYSVRAVFVRIREERLGQQFALRQQFDEGRDRQEKDLLRDAILLDEDERKTRVQAMFDEELRKFEVAVKAAPKLPRLILFD